MVNCFHRWNDPLVLWFIGVGLRAVLESTSRAVQMEFFYRVVEYSTDTGSGY